MGDLDMIANRVHPLQVGRWNLESVSLEQERHPPCSHTLLPPCSSPMPIECKKSSEDDPSHVRTSPACPRGWYAADSCLSTRYARPASLFKASRHPRATTICRTWPLRVRLRSATPTGDEPPKGGALVVRWTQICFNVKNRVLTHGVGCLSWCGKEVAVRRWVSESRSWRDVRRDSRRKIILYSTIVGSIIENPEET